MPVIALAGAARAEPVYTAQVAVDLEYGKHGNVEGMTSRGLSLDGSAGSRLTDRVTVSGFVRLRDTLDVASDDAVHTDTHPGQEAWLGVRCEVAATPWLVVGAGFAAFGMRPIYEDRGLDLALGLYAEAHVGFVVPAGTVVIEPLVELGHIDVGGNSPAGSIYGRAGVGLRW